MQNSWKFEKVNEIRGYFHSTKSKVFDLLTKRGMISQKFNTNKQIKAIDPKYYFLKQIRSNPKNVEIHDLQKHKVVLYPSTYKAALILDQNNGIIGMYNGKVWRNRCAIKVLSEFD